mmetsp:Transcript_11952/g.21437  ORF Transcript_11952/g.21437 Transcript_11952/m.21437 type:complete len:376 (-) Transcript_11952:110-1237(-)
MGKKHKSEEKEAKQVETDEERRAEKKARKKDKKANQSDEKPSNEPLPNSNKYCISYAIASSTIDHCTSLEQATNIAYSLARAAVIFSVDEIVVFDDTPVKAGADTVSASAAFLAKALQYLETPPYLRKQLFTRCDELDACDAFPPVAAHHHLSNSEWLPYREGVVLKSEAGKGSYVDIGLDRMCFIPENLPERQRITVSVGSEAQTEFFPAYSETMIKGCVSSPFAPKLDSEIGSQVSAWGFRVRLVRSLSKVMKNAALPPRNASSSSSSKKEKGGAYDVVIGTSIEGAETDPASLVLPKFQRILIVFGGAKGLTQALQADPDLKDRTPEDVFNLFLNTCPGPLSGQKISMRAEEAVLVTLGFLQNTIYKFGGIL